MATWAFCDHSPDFCLLRVGRMLAAGRFYQTRAGELRCGEHQRPLSGRVMDMPTDEAEVRRILAATIGKGAKR
jgi:hypothetical protein